MTGGIKRKLTIASLLVASFVWADNEAMANSWRHSHYVLVMSADDAVCKPLTNVYNQLLRKWLKNPNRTELVYSNDGSVFGPMPPMTDFEVTDPNVLEGADLFPPKPVKTMPDRKLYQLDIWGDGDSRLVSVKDSYESRGYDSKIIDRVTLIDIFKKGLTLSNVVWSKDPPPEWAPSLIDPAYLDGNADYRFISKSQNNLHHGRPFLHYLLKKWPPSNKKEKIGKYENYPMIFNFGTIRIFQNNSGKIYFLYDQGMTFPPESDPTIILLYTMKNNKPDDVCYLSFISE